VHIFTCASRQHIWRILRQGMHRCQPPPHPLDV
jgi:hypothetical protein